MRIARPTCRIYVGLPASGKTTDALRWVEVRPKSRARLSRDDMRRALHGKRYATDWQEDMVTDSQLTLLGVLLRRGVSVAVDDTNLHPHHVMRLAVVAAEAEADIEICDLTGFQPTDLVMRELLHLAGQRGVNVNVTMMPPVDVDRCIERDRARPEDQHVGADTIRGMFGRYLARVRPTG